jgi:hypothetical protein
VLRDGCSGMQAWRDIPFDEDRQHACGQRRRDARKLPDQRGSVRPHARSRYHLKAQTRRDTANVVGPNHPADERPTVRHSLKHRTAEVRRGSDVAIDDRDQLQVLTPEWHDSIRGTPGRMSATRDRAEAELVAQPSSGDIEILDGIDDVIDADDSSSPIQMPRLTRQQLKSSPACDMNTGLLWLAPR